MAKASTAEVVSSAIPELEAVDQIGDSDTMSVSDLTGASVEKIEVDQAKSGTDSSVVVAKEAAKAEAEAKTAESASSETAEVSKEEDTASTAAVQSDVPTELIEFAKQLQTEWGQDPAKATASLWNSMNQKEQAAFLQEITAAEGGKTEEYTPFEDSAIEKALAPVTKELVDYPKFRKDAEGIFESHAGFINQGHLKSEAALAAVEMILQSFGVDLPKPDYATYEKDLSKGYSEAIKPYRAELAKVAEKMKQGMKDRPAGTRSTSADTPTILASDDIATRLRKMRAAGKIG